MRRCRRAASKKKKNNIDNGDSEEERITFSIMFVDRPLTNRTKIMTRFVENNQNVDGSYQKAQYTEWYDWIEIGFVIITIVVYISTFA